MLLLCKLQTLYDGRTGIVYLTRCSNLSDKHANCFLFYVFVSSFGCTIVTRCSFYFFFQAEDGIRDLYVTGVQTCALPICTLAAGVARALDFHYLDSGALYRLVALKALDAGIALGDDASLADATTSMTFHRSESVV